MKNLFKALTYFSIMFIVLDMIVILGTTAFVENPRHPFTAEGLIENLVFQAVLLTVYLLSKVGIYLCNTYELSISRKR